LAFFFLGAVLLAGGVALAASPEAAGPEISTPPDPQSVAAYPVYKVPLCRDDETSQVCRQTDPCTGQVFFDATCCPQGTFGACAIGITRNGCITGTQAVCLGVI
jgi:hypothetical protein